ncbi:uncharacterized protein Z520_07178 [Fonsecaea multimorphosa CBS 102226]|uniref:Uncharacterized protein n=1 Tax=Fonsecaea multimorphosa CBS 102226 TaxID=1442371 RepID=A0A0D2K206_9EURO|nr:uncharacterized protein Z520_07178 [Fonsecaea multimorphosa CBS 102226]KIX97064.1 hypothetical protein Z520_07178 [Fonsecaea multimorphosa CBS 102226]OAL22840.1 hypothetical protein AYO22_06748 [Fonsecaea multimorphosa]
MGLFSIEKEPRIQSLIDKSNAMMDDYNLQIRTVFLALTLLLAIVYIFRPLLQIGKRAKDLPPGPPTLPILGNLHQLSGVGEYGHRRFQKWAEEYGPIYSLILGTKTYIVLNTDAAVKDLLDKRSAMYSSRPEMYMAHDIASGGLRTVTMPYGSQWRMMHTVTHSILNIKAATSYIPYQDLENKFMLVNLLDRPEEFETHIKLFTHALTTQIIFGFRFTSVEDPKFQQLYQGFKKWTMLVGSASAQLLDLYPLLRRLPRFLAPNYEYARKLHEKEKELYRSHWLAAKERALTGTGRPCFCNDLLKAQEREKFDDDQAAYISGSLLEAGFDTTASTLQGFILAMMMFPEVQKKAQRELDEVVGSDRLPTMDDLPELPYVHACAKESLRWMPTTVFAAPHATTVDDHYMGYRIPAGASVIPNVWYITQDPKRTPHPRAFDPTRHLNNLESEFESAKSSDVGKRHNFVFGAGRRLCQGMHIAERSLFLGVSRMLWGFDFSLPLDENGQPITIPDIDDLRGGAAITPAPFEAVIKPRAKERADLMRREWADAEAKFLDPQTKEWKHVPDGMVFSTYVPQHVDV